MQKRKNNINASICNPWNHAPRVECSNRAIEERIWSEDHQLLCNQRPITLIEYLAIKWVKKLNFFPLQRRVSKHLNPRIIVCKENLDLNEHLEFELGQYV